MVRERAQSSVDELGRRADSDLRICMLVRVTNAIVLTGDSLTLDRVRAEIMILGDVGSQGLKPVPQFISSPDGR